MIKILFLAANPKGTQQLRLDEEVHEITDRLRRSSFGEEFDIHTEWAVRTKDLTAALLRHKPNIVHFSGHGNADGILLEDQTGEVKPIPLGALRKLFESLKDGIRCVVLNACYSKPQAEAIAASIDAAVIGMRNNVSDNTSITFAASFYEALGFGRTVKSAFDLACINIHIEDQSEQDIPHLISINIDPDKIVFIVRKEGITMPSGSSIPTNTSSVVGNTGNSAKRRPGEDQQLPNNPTGMVSWALSHVPEMKYALGIAGLVAIIAIVKAWGVEPGLAALGVIVMLVLMVGLFLFTRLDKAKSQHTQLPVLALLYAFTAIIIATAFLLFTAVFFGWPSIKLHFEPLPDSRGNNPSKPSERMLNSSQITDGGGTAKVSHGGFEVVHPILEGSATDLAVPAAHRTPVPLPRSTSPPAHGNRVFRERTLLQPQLPQPVVILVRAGLGDEIQLLREQEVLQQTEAERHSKQLPTGDYILDGAGAKFEVSLAPGTYSLRCRRGTKVEQHTIKVLAGQGEYRAECNY